MNKFEKLQEIAREQFGIKIVRSENSSSFKEVFGFDVKEIKRK